MFHFMPESAKHVRDMTPYMAKLGADRLRAALDGMHPGMQKWREWCRGRTISSIILDQEYTEPDGTMSFLAAAMICRKTYNRKLAGRFSYIEAVYAAHILSGNRDHIGTVCREVLGSEPGRDKSRYTIPVHKYMRMAVGLGRRWKLVNRDVYGGVVRIHPNDMIRLLRDAITSYVRTRVTKGPVPPDTVVPPDIAQWCSAHDTAVQPPGMVPPCVAQCRDVMSRGENLVHAGRFLVATYHIYNGMDDDTISQMYEGAPDYDPKTTSYHIRQIRRRGYGVPGCGWITSNGLCPGCDAAHPTKYTGV